MAPTLILRVTLISALITSFAPLAMPGDSDSENSGAGLLSPAAAATAAADSESVVGEEADPEYDENLQNIHRLLTMLDERESPTASPESDDDQPIPFFLKESAISSIWTTLRTLSTQGDERAQDIQFLAEFTAHSRKHTLFYTDKLSKLIETLLRPLPHESKPLLLYLRELPPSLQTAYAKGGCRFLAVIPNEIIKRCCSHKVLFQWFETARNCFTEENHPSVSSCLFHILRPHMAPGQISDLMEALSRIPSNLESTAHNMFAFIEFQADQPRAIAQFIGRRLTDIRDVGVNPFLLAKLIGDIVSGRYIAGEQIDDASPIFKSPIACAALIVKTMVESFHLSKSICVTVEELDRLITILHPSSDVSNESRPDNVEVGQSIYGLFALMQRYQGLNHNTKSLSEITISQVTDVLEALKDCPNKTRYVIANRAFTFMKEQLSFHDVSRFVRVLSKMIPDASLLTIYGCDTFFYNLETEGGVAWLSNLEYLLLGYRLVPASVS